MPLSVANRPLSSSPLRAHASGGPTAGPSYDSVLKTLYSAIGETVHPEACCLMERKEAGACHLDGGLFPDQEQDVLGGLRLDEGQHVAAVTRRIAALLLLTGRAQAFRGHPALGLLRGTLLQAPHRSSPAHERFPKGD